MSGVWARLEPAWLILQVGKEDEAKQEEEAFADENIDQILAGRTEKRQIGSRKGNTFSTATFSSNEASLLLRECKLFVNIYLGTKLLDVTRTTITMLLCSCGIHYADKLCASPSSIARFVTALSVRPDAAKCLEHIPRQNS